MAQVYCSYGLKAPIISGAPFFWIQFPGKVPLWIDWLVPAINVPLSSETHPVYFSYPSNQRLN